MIQAASNAKQIVMSWVAWKIGHTFGIMRVVACVYVWGPLFRRVEFGISKVGLGSSGRVKGGMVK